MSIIQEALKKVGGVAIEDVGNKASAKDAIIYEPFVAERPIVITKKRSTVKIKKERSLVLPLVILLLITLIFYVKQSYGKRKVLPSAKNQIVNAGVLPTNGYPFVVRGRSSEPLSLENLHNRIASFSNSSNLVLNGIMYLEGGPRAIINNSVVSEGDNIGRASVLKIDRKSVTLKIGKEKLSLKI